MENTKDKVMRSLPLGSRQDVEQYIKSFSEKYAKALQALADR